MGHVVVPQGATSTSATIWVGAVVEPPRELELHVGGDRVVALDDAGWITWSTHGNPVFWSRRTIVDGLEPGRRYSVRLLGSGTQKASATAVTLPADLPPIGATPFTCMVGSCFAYFGDAAGAAGAAYRNLPGGARPDVKFLTGDQVYLDAPFPRFLYNHFSEAELQAELVSTYVKTWTQAGDGKGFAELLGDGATYFTSDDHEVWNNAPLPTAVVRNTWPWPLSDGGRAWWRLAGQLYDDAQTPHRTERFDVGRLSFFVLDTRLGRSGMPTRFARDEDLQALGEWVAGLTGPGVLVVGQPIFVSPTGPIGFLKDLALADYEQYADLVRMLCASNHDLIVLTGDVHYGRISGCRLASGAALVEVIASPLALVHPLVKGKWQEPPQLFPAYAIPGTAQRETWFEPTHDLNVNNFATLEFSSDGSRVLTSVRAWAIPEPGHAPTSTVVFQQRLQ